MGRERREHERLPVEMWVTETHDQDTYYQRSGNLSPGGIYLDGTIPHPRGTIVTLQFTLPGESDSITCRGIVVGDPSEAHLGMHVMFVDIADHKVQRRLSRYLKRAHEPDPDPK